jgi:AAA+ superfamily predicted ATPase
VSRINVLVASTSVDTKAEVIAERVAARSDMNLIGGRCLKADDLERFLDVETSLAQLAVILLGKPAETREIAERWIAKRPDLVVVLVDLVDDVIRIQAITLRDPRLDALLTALRNIVERVGPESKDRVVRIELPTPAARVDEEQPTVDAEEKPGESADSALVAGAGEDGEMPPGIHDRPLLDASVEWLYRLLRDAVERTPAENGDVHGLSVTRATLLEALDTPLERAAQEHPADLAAADRALDAALVAARSGDDPDPEPLAIAARRLDLGPLDFRMLLLGLAPEIDFRFQRCIGFLLDEMGRRTGTFGLYTTLLGASTRVRRELADSGALDRWCLVDGAAGQHAAADEPFRIDQYAARWLLGEAEALGADPRVRRVVRLDPWLGAALLNRPQEHCKAADLFRRLPRDKTFQWLVLNRADASGWRALIELGATIDKTAPIRVDAARLSGLDLIEIVETAGRLVRYSRCTRRPLVVDSVKAESTDGDDEWLRAFFAGMSHAGCRALVVCADEARIVAFLGKARFLLIDEDALSPDARVEAIRSAAEGADVYLSNEDARAMASRFPLRVDALEEAMHLAQSRALDYTADDPRVARFTTACKELVAEGISHLADRLEPIFELDDVVLPADRKSQLIEIVDNVRLAHVVLDEWRFGERLPYGRGVTALFFGPSGTGKTMAAMGIARRLDIQILRLDLSRVVSKYIGDTEKNIDRVFTDAQRTGAAILIDEADALLGRRSEVKDAHDRYANIEVAFLLQRMEAYDGLAILTSNMRQTLDPAFLRRLRFIIEFPRPDADARDRIWRQCLPAGTHTLNDAAFRQLARKVDVTGGYIRQITLRAAFIAAAAGSQITLEHVAQAARAELAKLGMPAVELDVAQVRAA